MTSTIRNKASDLPGADWFKSSYSDGGEQCVEVADIRTALDCVAIRDSKSPDGPALLVAPSTFASFIGDVAINRFGD
ncbi:DUF397 domain-containing protein [Streptomyces sp. NPDC001233]|uniref:DUF397 domain-containing protein n=1 Tax=Streptomyces sp. NPDC002589 TaxID=3154420 RepID=UPI003320A5BF